MSLNNQKLIDQERYNKALLDENTNNPFPEPPASNYINTNPAKFIVGRTEHLNKLFLMYEDVRKSGTPKLAYIQGGQGVGKSTLASWFVKEMQKDENQHKILLIPIETSPSSGDMNFLKFYKTAINTFLSNKTLHWIGYRLTIQLLKTIEKNISYNELNKILEQLGWDNNIYQILQKEPDLLKKYSNNILKNLSNIYENYFNNIIHELPTTNFELVLILWHSIFGKLDTFKAIRALQGISQFNDFWINNDYEAKQTFKDLIALIKWISPETVILIIIDHLEAAIANAKDSYNDLFSLLLQMRHMNHIMILLSGTFDAYDKIEDVIKEDMNKQIQNWGLNNQIILNPLEVDEVQQVVNRYLQSYWDKFSLSNPHNNLLYPFSKETIEYMYLISDKDLRKLLEQLHFKIKEYRDNKRVVPITTLFEAFKMLNKDSERIYLKKVEIDILVKKILDPKLKPKNRSSSIEKAIYNTLKLLSNKTNLIYNVKHEPPLGKDKLKPDIYFETGKEFGNSRRIAIEVKIYTVGEKIPKNEVKKTHSLLESGIIDYLIWYTNVPLDNIKFQISDELKNRIGRVKELTEDELAYITILAHQDELITKPLNSKEIIESYLIKAGLDINNICKQAMELPIAKPIKIKQTDKKMGIENYFDNENKGVIIVEKGMKIKSKEERENDEKVKILAEIMKHDHKSYVRIKTIIKNLKKNGLDLMQYYNEDEAANIILKIARNNGLNTTPATIKFSKR